MKKVVFLFIGVCFCKIAFAVEPNEANSISEANSIESLISQIAQLKAIIAEQEKQLIQLKKENIKLKSLCQQTGIDTKDTLTQTSNKKCIYRGMTRDDAWIERMLERCGKYIADVNGQYVYINEIISKNSGGKFRSNIPEGTILKLPKSYKVMQSLGEKGLLIYREPYTPLTPPPGRGGGRVFSYDPQHISADAMSKGGPPIEPPPCFPEILHIQGCPRNYIDDEPFESSILICKGIYNDDMGKTVPSLSLLEIKPITKEQFIEAINTGLLLYDYIKNKDGKIEKKLML